MPENTTANNPLDGYEVLPQDRWASHPWLSLLQSGSDQESDSAVFWADLNSGQIESLAQIVVQHRKTDGDWEDAIVCEGAVFPGRDWAIASWGWYRPIQLFQNFEFEMRALIPNDWKSPSR